MVIEPLEPWRDIAIALLAEKGFEGFSETKTGLLTYIQEAQFHESLMSDIETLEGVKDHSIRIIEEQNWNAEWENNFEPVFVEEKLAIVAPFHEGPFAQEKVVVIQPQMSFGTGHHQTTWLMAKRLFELPLAEMGVLDMGTGTGVLAILAEKLGAANILAIDNDPWSFENALANADLNDCTAIKIELGDDGLLNGMTFDLILANINKNTLIEHFSVYSRVLKPGGKLLISGFFTTDHDELVRHAGQESFDYIQMFNRDEWALLEFSKRAI